MFATELLRALEEEALLRPADDGWTLGELDRVVVPSFLRQVIDGRVARLGEATRQPLAIAAVIGQEVPLALWAEVADLDDEALLTIVERAVDAHLLEADPDGRRVRFVHALTREALYEGVLPPRRRLWHRRVGEALAAGTRPDPDAVAYHFQAAGDPRAWEWLVAAGDRAQRAYAWLTAAERLRAAAALLEDVEGQERTRGRLACRIAYLKRFSDPAGAIEAIDDAARVAARIGDAVMAAEVRWLRGLLLCYADRFRSGLAEMIAGIEALEAMPPEAARVPAAIQAWLADALPAATTIDAAEDEHGRGPTRRRRRCGLARRLPRSVPRLRRTPARGGRWLRAVRCRARRRARGEGRNPRRRRVRLPRARHRPGGPRATRRGARGVRPGPRDLRGTRPPRLGRVHAARRIARRRADLRRGRIPPRGAGSRPRRRRRWAGPAAPSVRASRPAWPGSAASSSTAGGRRRTGSCATCPPPATPTSGARSPPRAPSSPAIAATRSAPGRRSAACFPDGPATEPGDLIHQEGLFLQRLAADLCLDAGDLPAARAWLEAHDRWLAWSESVLGRADGQVAWARYHRAAGDIARARAAADRCPGARRRAGSAAGLAWPPTASSARSRPRPKNHAAAEEHLAAALDLATACDAPFERALTLLALAELRLMTGVTDEAATLLDEVRGICGPARRGADPRTRRRARGAAHAGATSTPLSCRPDAARGGGAAPPAARTL